MWLRLVLLVALIAGGIACYSYLNSPSKYVARQVKSLPEPLTDTKPALDFSTHVRFSPRPEETFNFPIAIGASGPSQPLYAGPAQYPFYCMTIDSGLGQPQVDNQQGWGVPVYQTLEQMGNKNSQIGYSKDCSLATQVSYGAELENGDIVVFASKAEMPQQARQLFQLEIGTINRFIYLIIMPLSQLGESDVIVQSNPNNRWNGKLIYQFLGGSGIGFRQGKMRAKRAIERRIEQLRAGYAVITSTGNKTSYTYNMLLAEDTARRVKHQFVSLYGQPEYTVGIGGSGGGLAQYLIGQNSTGILDAAIPLYSYPDMISQTLYALDCDLFNNYYAFRSPEPSYWQHWPNRIHLEGMNARNGDTHVSAVLEPVNQLLSLRWPQMPQGNSECINGWFGLSTYIHNPAQGFLREFFADDVVSDVHWSYWEDMVDVFGRDNAGFANQTWDNQGVQYGLTALKQGDISPQRFIDINWYIGGWKPLQEMASERLLGASLGKKGMLWLSLWSRHNISQASSKQPAPRMKASTQAVEMAYRSGQVFIGEIDLPIIDVRHYLEAELDMHHFSASLATRLRMKAAQGHAKNQVIWVADKNHTPVNEAFTAIDNWMQARLANPKLAAWQVKPNELTDTCFDEQGQVIAAGTKVWHGSWNQQPAGKCAQHFPPFSNSRVMAGGPWSGSIFSCHKVPVTQAIKQGVYGDIDMSSYQQKLTQIFPDGVCDYQQGDQARPSQL